MELTDFQVKWARLLAQYGGYSHKYIAARVFGKKTYIVTDHDVKLVKKALYSGEKILVTDFRNGRTIESQDNADRIERMKRIFRANKAG